MRASVWGSRSGWGEVSALVACRRPWCAANNSAGMLWSISLTYDLPVIKAGGTAMSITLDQVRQRERDALLGEYVFPNGVMGTANVPPYAAIPSISILTNSPSQLRSKHPLSIDPFPGGDLANGFVQQCSSLGYKFLWLRPEDDNYKATYEAFLRRHYSIAIMPTGYDVDHLFNRARASELKLAYVRMVLLGPGENRSHGAGYEKSRTKGGIGKSGRERGIDEIMLMKLCGVRSPRKNKPLSPEMIVHIHRIAALFNMQPLEIEQNIRELMEVAAFRPDDDGGGA